MARSYVYSLLLLLAAASCSTQKCAISPLWLFSKAEDIISILQGVESDLVLVENGVTSEVLTNREFAIGNLRIFEAVDEFPLVWCIQSTEIQSVQYSLSLESDDTSILEDPDVTVPTQGNITTVPYRFRLTFRCLPGDSRSATGITLTLNITSPTGVQYCPTIFFFGKRCFAEGSTRGSGELPTSLQAHGITDGYLNISNLSIKSTASSFLTETLPGNSVVSNVLKGVLIPLCALALVALVIGILVWVLWYRKTRSKIAEFQPDAVHRAYREIYALSKSRGQHEKEFPLVKLTIVRELGEGAFGVVSQAHAKGIVMGEEDTDVAVKQLRGGSNEVDDFFREVDFMSGLDHPNIVMLLGVCSIEEPFSMVFEYMDLGDLCSFLREAIGLGKDVGDNEERAVDEEAPTEPLLTNEELLSIALQVSEGMVYISSKHLVHRDLAARNCLVSTGLVVKIADFGMSRNVDTTDYYRVKGSAMLPVRWMPPESILYGKFTVESDLWAFGILLWEIFTFGQKPYFGIQDEEVILRIKECKHPAPPPECPTHHLMLQCWNRSPKKRPRFEECRKQIQQLLSEQ